MTTLSDYQKWSQTYGCESKNFESQKLVDDCIAANNAKQFAEIAQMRVDGERQQLIEYFGIGALFVVTTVVVLARRPIWKFVEGLFISGAAKTLSTKRDLAAYKDDVARQIREKADSK